MRYSEKYIEDFISKKNLQILIALNNLIPLLDTFLLYSRLRGGSRAAATSKMERFVIIVNG